MRKIHNRKVQNVYQIRYRAGILVAPNYTSISKVHKIYIRRPDNDLYLETVRWPTR